MSIRIILKFIYAVFFTANQTFAATYYAEKKYFINSSIEKVGDLSFSYSKSLKDTHVQEIIEKEFIRLIIDRDKSESLLTIEQKTKKGFLYLIYQGSSQGWKMTKVSFRAYEEFYKDLVSEECSSSPRLNNQADVLNLKNQIETDKFSSFMFENNCREKLSEKEFKQLSSSIFTLLAGDKMKLDSIRDPKSVQCVAIAAENSPLKNSFETLRSQIAIIQKESYDPVVVKSHASLPLPISCDIDGVDETKCAALKEGKKSKIRFNVACLKKDPQNFTAKAQGLFMHEFPHSIRQPKLFTEQEIRQLDQGNCSFKVNSAIFASSNEFEISKKNLSKATNLEQIEHAPKDVINPYAAFKPPTEEIAEVSAPATTSVSSQTTSSVANPTTIPALARRSVASAPNREIDTPLPSVDAIPLAPSHYPAVKQYVNSTVATLSKRIAPIVNYVESPAFAADYPKSAAANSESVPAPAPNDPAAKASENTEIASSSRGTATTAPLTRSIASAPGGFAKKAKKEAVAKPPSNSADLGLDNAYALKIRKRLLVDKAFGTKLRNNGVNIEFEDGYKFESAKKQIKYFEKNGVLERGDDESP